MKFDDRAVQALGSYVYALVNPDTGLPFYIGKGEDNRVFSHVNEASVDRSSDKLELIDEIGRDRVKHVILRHGMTESEALLVESVLIDFFKNTPGLESLAQGNAVMGHGTSFLGYRTAEEIAKIYSSEPLMSIDGLIGSMVWMKSMRQQRRYGKCRSVAPKHLITY